MIILSHPTGNANSRHALSALAREKLLSGFVTSVATFEGNIWGKLSKLPGMLALKRRSYDSSLSAMTHQVPFLELLRISSEKLPQPVRGLLQPSVDQVYESVDLATAKILKSREDVRGVYAYEDGAKASFEMGKRLGMRCLYDLPIGYWRSAQEIQLEESELKPEWASTMPSINEPKEKLEKKEEELAMADEITVASQFTLATLSKSSVDLNKVTVIPYGCPETTKKDVERNPKGNLRALYVGSLTQRKGISYLFDSMRDCSSFAKLTVLGKGHDDCEILKKELATHRWIPSMPHESVFQVMDDHDVLVFPSLFEGFGLVVTEALSRGMVVIVTANTCGPDLITNGEEGFIVPLRSSEAITEKMELLNRDRELLFEMKMKALSLAKRRQWSSYESQLANWVKDKLD